MLTTEKTSIADLLRAKEYRRLKALLRTAQEDELAQEWFTLPPLDKLIVFKLMDAGAALDFYKSLPLKGRYFLLSGFPLNAIAPILEDASPEVRRLFVALPSGFYKVMLSGLK